MQLPKAIILGTAVVAAGVLGLTPAVQATTITGNKITNISVGGSSVAGTVPVTGIFKSGTATFDALGFTTTCTSGSVGGTVNRGPFTSGSTAFTFTSLSITCFSPLMINATISLASGCTVPVTMGGVRAGAGGNDNVHSGLVDTGTYTGLAQKNHNILGALTAPGSNCIKVTLSSGGCIAYAQGTTGAQFNETQKTASGISYQDLIYKGTSSMSLYGQNGFCLGIMSGTVSLNNIDFNIAASTGAIDFQ
jgi:hypothetical protein